nr:MAG TPA: hypothetical protein [Caudoviricetes sp.]DAN47666.1 MAG TPA: hypothetical protein [Caudoviricetes sp.]
MFIFAQLLLYIAMILYSYLNYYGAKIDNYL